VVAERSIRVIVADDNPSIRENLRYLINAEPDMHCIDVSRDGVEAVRLCKERVPDVLVVDEDMPRATGLKVLEHLAQELPKLRVILYTLNGDACERARALGAAGCVLKDSQYEVLLRTIRGGAFSADQKPLPLS
jgi:DNA-binding NarL/FixJ family response regulator